MCTERFHSSTSKAERHTEDDVLKNMHTKMATAICMSHILDKTMKTMKVAGMVADLFRLFKLLAGTKRVMTKPPWSRVYQLFSKSSPH